MSTEAEIEARRTAIAIVRAVMDGDNEAGMVLLSTAEEPRELMAALEGFGAGLAAATDPTDAPPAFDIDDFAPTFDALLAYTIQRLDLVAQVEGITSGQVLDRLALAALEDD